MADNNELERTLLAAADKMRSNMDAAEYKHVVLGLIFLKYISDAFNDLYQKLKEGKGEFEGADPEDVDEYLTRNKTNHKFRDRLNEILFIDARKLGVMINRRNKELADEDIALISGTYHNWRNKKGKYEDKVGFCKSATIEEIEAELGGDLG
jgi:type I restriction-modification system DNA methylase subunit